MGFFKNLTKAYDDFQDKSLERKKKNLKRLRERAAIDKETNELKAEINQSKAKKAEAFNELLQGKGGGKGGGGVNQWF